MATLAHYKGGRGYQPAVIYWAEQDLVIGDEFRDGNVPAAMANLALIRRGFANLPPTITAYRFRADSACYEQAVLKWLVNPEREDGPQGECTERHEVHCSSPHPGPGLSRYRCLS